METEVWTAGQRAGRMPGPPKRAACQVPAGCRGEQQTIPARLGVLRQVRPYGRDDVRGIATSRTPASDFGVPTTKPPGR